MKTRRHVLNVTLLRQNSHMSVQSSILGRTSFGSSVTCSFQVVVLRKIYPYLAVIGNQLVLSELENLVELLSPITGSRGCPAHLYLISQFYPFLEDRRFRSPNPFSNWQNPIPIKIMNIGRGIRFSDDLFSISILASNQRQKKSVKRKISHTHTHTQTQQSSSFSFVITKKRTETTMAATVSAWAKPGAWALDSEENESELVQLQKNDSFPTIGNGNGNGNGNDSGDYPTLKAAAAAPKSKKKSKGQTLSLQEFTSKVSQPVVDLPKGPSPRTQEELDQSRRFTGGYSTRDDQPRRQRDSNREYMPPAPSRADEVDNWKKPATTTNGGGFERRDRREYFPDSSSSRADEVDNWGKNKAFVPSDRRISERRGYDANNGGRADSDNWVKRKEEDGKKFGSSFDSLRERRGGGVASETDSDNWSGRKREEITNGGGGGGERRRLNLQPRTLPLESSNNNDNNESSVKPKGSNPFGDARPREEVLKEKGQDLKEIEENPSESDNIENESFPKSKGSNPFGDARPREEVLKEKGQDWKEIEEKLESAKNAKESAGEERERRRRGFGSGSWKGSLAEDRGDEPTWRKPAPPAQEVMDAPTPSAQKEEDGTGEEADDKEPQI
ncbi:OLC1v1003446C1 [Oldenlandia corymbosa var. corymbosa]|uniref:OLC1v1003446C1 n=1 Tax=Oldenlandia corymbosa var. corymbosa TaxID=529605 RepID=A0AAV1DCF5_OLDCO|nr:OLC1v1003446C1 [Oldenlandia corymbosa var. corymbosa]